MKDGSQHIGAVNHVGGYVANDTVMVVDGFAIKLLANRTFTVTGSTKTHKITSQAPSSGATTTITFTPGLTGSVADDAVITVGPLRIDVTLGEGNFTWSEKKPREYLRNRGRLNTVRDGDEEPVEVKLDAEYEFITGVAASELPTPVDVVKQKGEAAGWVSTSDDRCEPFSIDLELEYTPLCSGVDKEIVTIADYRNESIDFDPKAGTFSFSGKANVTEATVVRVAQ